MNQLKGAIRRFGYYSEAQLQKTKEDLQLGLSMQQLLEYSLYYRTQERRDPLIFELRLLDSLHQKATVQPLFAQIERFCTNDPFVAQTYADMIEKRGVLSPDATEPPTLAECLHLATAYAERAGKPAALKKQSPELRSHSVEDGIGISGFPLRLCLTQASEGKKAPQNGDRILLLLPKKEKCEADVQAWLSSFAKKQQWKCMGEVRQNGLLAALTELAPTGLWIDLAKLAEENAEPTVEALTDTFLGSYFVCVTASEATIFSEQAEAAGIEARFIASVACYNRIIFTQNEKDLFSLPTDFLRTVLFTKRTQAALSDESGEEMASITNQLTSNRHCIYLRQSQSSAQAQITEQNGVRCAAAASAPVSHFYKNALYTALSPIVGLAISGTPYSELRLATALTVPSHAEKAFGDTLSAILGLYRVQAELGIPAATERLLDVPDAEHPTLTTFAVAHGGATPNHYMQAGNRICCLTPVTDEYGLPDFAALRDMLKALTAQAQNGDFCSTRVLCNKSLADGLQEMSHSSLTYQLADGVDVNTPFPLAILLECKAEDMRYPQIASVQALTEESAEEEAPLPTVSSMIWSDKTEIVLLSEAADLDAQVLAEILCKKGASAHLFTINPERFGMLSRAILTSHILILCKGVELPEDAQVRFATDTLLRAGGICLSLGSTSKTSPDLPIRFIPNGLTEEMLNMLIH